MGVFHCPLGAPFKGGNNCIDCGLCTASSKEEYKAASEKVRAAIRSTAGDRLEYYKISKIAVCGKGGCGKSTFAAMLARSLEKLGYEVLILDTDESNAGLYKKLGMPGTGKPLLRILGSGFAEYEEVDTEWLKPDKIAISDIPAEYLQTQGRIHLLVTGKILDPFQGCACGMSDLTRDLLLKLNLKDGQIVIADIEAGVESFGRGVERGADTVIDIVEPSFDSIELASRIKYMSEGVGIRRVRAVLNKMPNKDIEKAVLKQLHADEMRHLGCIGVEDSVVMAGLMGQPVADEAFLDRIKRMTMLMLDEAEMPYLKA